MINMWVGLGIGVAAWLIIGAVCWAWEALDRVMIRWYERRSRR